MKHGTPYAYKQGCRCEPCVTARSAYKQQWTRRNKPSVYPRHRNVRQWPLAPLLEVVPDLRERLDLDGVRWRRATEACLSDRTADHWATSCGWHPGCVWDDWFERALTPLDEQFVNGGPGAEPGWRQAALHDAPTDERNVA